MIKMKIDLDNQELRYRKGTKKGEKSKTHYLFLPLHKDLHPNYDSTMTKEDLLLLDFIKTHKGTLIIFLTFPLRPYQTT